MKKLYCCLTSLFIVILLSCGNNTGQNLSEKVILDNSIPFEYDAKMLKMIVLEGVINDSIPVNVIYDTGGGKGILVSDSINSLLNLTAQLQIDTFKKTVDVSYLKSSDEMFRIIGKNTVVVGLDFFDGKILKISYKDKKITILNDTCDLEGYSCIPMLKEKHLAVPIEAYLQGKTIKENVMIDTGSNDALCLFASLTSKYNIDTREAYHGFSSMAQGRTKGRSISADSINLGGYSVANSSLSFIEREIKSSLSLAGLVGNRYLENFDLILDLKKYNLYLKKVNY